MLIYLSLKIFSVGGIIIIFVLQRRIPHIENESHFSNVTELASVAVEI